jgi:hypothetical protein
VVGSPRDFIIVGRINADGSGVTLLASNDISDVHLTEQWSLRGGARIDLCAQLGNYLKIPDAPTFFEALARLFTQWNPDGGAPAIGAGHPPDTITP